MSGDSSRRALVVLAGLFDAGALVVVITSGLLVPPPVVVVGLVAWVVATAVMVWRLRARDQFALVVPLVLVASWWLLMLLGLFVFGWTA